MNEAEFWRIIETTRYASAGDGEKQAELLVEYLSQLSEGEILDFDAIYRHCIEQADKFALWEAASIINGGCSSDSFDYFRAWLIGQGQKVYEKAIADPDSLVDAIEPGGYASLEVLNYVAKEAYEIKMGSRDMPIRQLPLNKEYGSWSKNHAQSHPKLYAKFHAYWNDY